MPTSRHPAALIVVLAIAVGALAISAVSAQAIVPINSSQITTPAGTTYLLTDEAAEGPDVTIAGTSNMSEVDIRCYYSSQTNGYTPLAEKVEVSGGAFSVSVPRKQFEARNDYELCRLRAVPVGSSDSLSPGTQGFFQGPLVLPSNFAAEPGYSNVTLSSLEAMAYITQAERCGVETHLVNQSLERTPYLFYCAGGVVDALVGETEPSMKVDGAAAYGPGSAHQINERVKATLPGTPEITILSRSFNESTGDTTYTESDAFVHCAPEANAVPEVATCSSFVSAGVTLERTVTTSSALKVIAVHDSWRSTDGKPHEIAVNYFDEFEQQESPGNLGAFEFPGTGSFAGTAPGETVPVPAGPGSVLYRWSSATPDAGDGVNPQGALVYDRAPSGPLKVTVPTSKGEEETVYEAPYTLAVPAGGATTVRMTYITGFGLPEIRAEAEAAIAGFAPSIAITGPASGVTVEPESATVTVTGTAADSGLLSGVSVNGVAASIGAGGAWSATVPLKAGANTITATATDQAGITKSAAITVNYKIPPGKGALSGKVTVSNGKVIFSLKCTGAVGSKCSVKDSLVTVERRNRSKIVGLLARIKKRSVTIASGAQSIEAGKTLKVTLKLNATGRALLKKFHKIPAHLTVSVAGLPKAKTVISKSLTVKPAKAKHKKH